MNGLITIYFADDMDKSFLGYIEYYNTTNIENQNT